MSFSGFSEEDIKKVTNNKPLSIKQEKVNRNSASKPQPLKKVTFKTTNHKPVTPNSILVSNQARTLPQNKSDSNIDQPHTDTLPNEAKLSNYSTTPNKEEIKSDLSSEISSVNSNLKPFTAKQDPGDLVPTDKKASPYPESKDNGNIGDEAISPRKIDLGEFEARQKLIEEQNRKRKELLAKALADRTKQTQAEAQRLGAIQDEFRKLDALLSNDVKILRKQIELASLEYLECQKKYVRIEKEFLEAKLCLHQKLERKEMLTEHLCTIIEKNEDRKAEKLTELLDRLQVDPQRVESNKINENGAPTIEQNCKETIS